jgi:tRNA(Ile)-lysidine synthase
VKPAAAFGPAELAVRLRALVGTLAGARLAVAFSGGGDSLALLAALAVLARRHRGLAVRALHVDHGLQRGSRAWARRCRALAAGLGVPFVLRRAQVHAPRGQSLEAAARSARYALLARALAPGECLLTAHHLEDQAETVLLQLLRGSGVAGLAAMPVAAPLGRGRLLRPLLEVPRAALRAYVDRRGLECIEDPMNLDGRFDRVHVRLDVLPRLLARWPGAVRSLARTAAHARDARQLLGELADSDGALAADGAGLSVRVLRRLSPARRRNLVRGWIARQGGRVPDARRLAQIVGPLLDAREDAQPLVAWEGGVVRRAAGRLEWESALQAARPAVAPAIDAWRWRDEPSLLLPGGRGRLELRQDPHGDLDLDSLPAVLAVRWRRGGECLRPRPGGPARSLKGLLQVARIGTTERAAMPLLYSGAQLVAAGDRWIDAAYQACVAARARGAARTRGRILWHRARPRGRDLVT